MIVLFILDDFVKKADQCFLYFRYIQRSLDVVEGFQMPVNTSADFDSFCGNVGEDGVMVLKLISSNCSEHVVRDIVCFMWTLCYPAGRQDNNTTSSGHPGVHLPMQMTSQPHAPDVPQQTQTTQWQGQTVGSGHPQTVSMLTGQVAPVGSDMRKPPPQYLDIGWKED